MARRPAPLVVEEHLGPIDPKELLRKQKLGHCDQSPTGSHVYTLSKLRDGTDDGPCQYCQIMHSKVHRHTTQKENKKERKFGGRKNMANLVTVNDLAKETGCDARIIRRILRKSFNGGSKKTYGWEKGNPELKEIRLAIKNRGTKPAAEKPAKEKAGSKAPETKEKKTSPKADKKPAIKKTTTKKTTTKKTTTKKTTTKKPAKATPKETETGADDAAAAAALDAATDTES